ncbi:TPA: hypothetical protein HMG31_05520, partial [Escherichia coli]|nr:hypothetical protein [Escherichia coli]HAJ1446913.1 hypothetical protein [Escherichia coli]
MIHLYILSGKPNTTIQLLRIKFWRCDYLKIPAFQIISDRYYLRESPATFPVRGVLSFFTGNTCMN